MNPIPDIGQWQMRDDELEIVWRWGAYESAHNEGNTTMDKSKIKSIRHKLTPENSAHMGRGSHYALRLLASDIYRFAEEFPDLVEIEYYEGPGAPDKMDNTVYTSDAVLFAREDELLVGTVQSVEGTTLIIHGALDNREYTRPSNQVMRFGN